MKSPIFPGLGSSLAMLGCLLSAAAFLPCEAEGQTFTVFHTTGRTAWEIYDLKVANAHRPSFDALINPVEATIPLLDTWFGEFAPATMKFKILQNKCSAGWGNPVEFGDTCAVQDWPRRWIRTFLIGRTADMVWNPVSGGWPDDSFAGPFRDMVAATLIKSVLGPDSVAYFENEYMDKAKRPQYLAYIKLRDARGWGVFRELFRAMKRDTLLLDKVPQDPGLRGNYVMAYLNLGNREKLAATLKADGVPGFDPAEVTRVLAARNLLAIADRKGINSQAAWKSFRAGKHAEVKGLLGPLPKVP